MIYEVRTYTLRTGAVAEFEDRFAKRKPLREKHSALGAFWHTDFGPLNQVVHVWPYEDLKHRTTVRDAMAKDTALQALPGGRDLIVEQQADIMIPRPVHAAARAAATSARATSTRCASTPTRPAIMPAVLEAWGKAVPDPREALAAGGMLDPRARRPQQVRARVATTPYERTRIREESRKGGQWPPQSGVRPIRQDYKMLIPAAFQPLR